MRSIDAASKKLNSNEGDSKFYDNKVIEARFYIKQVLPRAGAHGTAVVDGANIGCELTAEAFS